jgi:hypothetical protein
MSVHFHETDFGEMPIWIPVIEKLNDLQLDGFDNNDVILSLRSSTRAMRIDVQNDQLSTLVAERGGNHVIYFRTMADCLV